MDPKIIAAAQEKFPQIKQQQPLASLNTMAIGGPAALYFKLTDNSQLPEIIEFAQANNVPFFVLGAGSNTVFSDEGFDGLLIHMASKNIKVESDPNNLDHKFLIADSGLLLSQVIQFTLKNNLSGLEKLTGLPGTLGGAVRGNAGAFGTEIKDFFHAADILTFVPEDKPKRINVSAKDMNFGYRTSIIKQKSNSANSGTDLILSATLSLPVATPESAKIALQESKDILINRISKQPKGHCSGSVFKNPNGDSVVTANTDIQLKAGWLLENSGCKGLKIGDAEVSPSHANWVFNLNKATQKDLIKLMQEMQNRVLEKYKIKLEPEIQLVGPFGPISI